MAPTPGFDGPPSVGPPRYSELTVAGARRRTEEWVLYTGGFLTSVGDMEVFGRGVGPPGM